MTRTLIIIALISTGVIVSGFYPILLPQAFITGANAIVHTLLTLEGIIPVRTLLTCVIFALSLELAIMSFKITKWIVG